MSSTQSLIAPQRFTEINILKGIAILMIIGIHSTSFLIDELPVIHKFFCSFSLCLFFLVSGFLYHHDATPLNDFFEKKIKRLFYPYIFFAAVNIMLRYVFSSVTNNPDNGDIIFGLWKIFSGQFYWFLYSMFLILLINRVFHKYRKVIMVLFLLTSITNFVDTNVFTLNNTLYYNLFFCLGFYTRRHYDIIKNFLLNNSVILLPLLTILFVVSLCILPDSGFNRDYIMPIIGCALCWGEPVRKVTD